jgi:hypothetical protein
MEGELGWIACRAGQLIPYLAQKKTRDGGGAGRESLKELLQPYTCKCEIIVTGVSPFFRTKIIQ